MQPSFYNHLCKFKSATFLFRVSGCYLSSGYLVVSAILGFVRFPKRGRLVLKFACPFVSSVFVVSVFIASVFVASVFIASEVRPSSVKRKYAVPPPDEVRQESLRQALRTPQ